MTTWKKGERGNVCENCNGVRKQWNWYPCHPLRHAHTQKPQLWKSNVICSEHKGLTTKMTQEWQRKRDSKRERADSRDEIKGTNVSGKTKKKKALLPAAVQMCSLVPKSKTHPARPRAANHAAAEPSKARTCDSSLHGVTLAGRLPYEAVQLCTWCMLRTKIKASKNCITILHQVKVSR